MNFLAMKDFDQKTRLCTPVIFNTRERVLDLRLACRSINFEYKNPLKPFKPNLKMRKDVLEDILSDLAQDEKRKTEKNQKRRESTSRKDQVNLLRTQLSVLITESSCQSIRSIARTAGCHPSTVRSVFQQMAISGGPLHYDYNKQHSQEQVKVLDELIADPGSLYFTTQDYKRRALHFSKRFIRKRLKASGLKYKKLSRQRKESQERRLPPTELKKVIWTVVQAMAKGDDTILFLDEAVFPCMQTSEHCWMRKSQEVIYNRRESDESLNVIALCSQSGFVAFQVYTTDINKQAIHYFLTQVLDRLDERKKWVILLDNAGWHQSNLILKSSMRELLLFNVAYCWETNLIENTFSKMKSLWRTRRVVNDLDDEIKSLVEIFRSSWRREGEEDFEGYRRQYYRQLEALLPLI